jgi:hypothetical protein
VTGKRGDDPAFQAWIERGRTARVAAVLDRVSTGHAKLLRGRGELVGPCPVCRAGKDRFAINTRKNVWSCRRCAGITGGDAIALAQAVTGCDFLEAVEIATGEPRPDKPKGESAEQRARREAQAREILAAIEADQARREAEAESYRERERASVYKVWKSALKLTDPSAAPALAYFAARAVELPEGVRLRFKPDWTLYGERGEDGSRPVVHRGPAIFAPIVDEAGRFLGLHATWIDPDRPGKKVEVPDPVTGELVPAKKVRGSKKGGRIVLVGRSAPTRLFVGEGTETVLSVWTALRKRRPEMLDGAAFETSVDLGNLAGKAANRERHPTETIVDSRGRARAKLVPGAEPDWSSPAFPVPDSVTDLVLLGDGDSEPVFTRLALLRAARRAARPGRTVRLAMAPSGADFNDVLRGRA